MAGADAEHEPVAVPAGHPVVRPGQRRRVGLPDVDDAGRHDQRAGRVEGPLGAGELGVGAAEPERAVPGRLDAGCDLGRQRPGALPRRRTGRSARESRSCRPATRSRTGCSGWRLVTARRTPGRDYARTVNCSRCAGGPHARSRRRHRRCRPHPGREAERLPRRLARRRPVRARAAGAGRRAPASTRPSSTTWSGAACSRSASRATTSPGWACSPPAGPSRCRR